MKAPTIPIMTVTNQAETCAPNDLAGQPPRNEANERYDKKTFIRHMHGGALGEARPTFPHGPRRLARDCLALY
jgi:hypothetical protein